MELSFADFIFVGSMWCSLGSSLSETYWFAVARLKPFEGFDTKVLPITKFDSPKLVGFTTGISGGWGGSCYLAGPTVFLCFFEFFLVWLALVIALEPPAEVNIPDCAPT